MKHYTKSIRVLVIKEKNSKSDCQKTLNSCAEKEQLRSLLLLFLNKFNLCESLNHQGVDKNGFQDK